MLYMFFSMHFSCLFTLNCIGVNIQNQRNLILIMKKPFIMTVNVEFSAIAVIEPNHHENFMLSFSSPEL